MKTTIAILICCLCGFVGAQDDPDRLRCGNLIYAGTKSSTCFSEKFLKTVKQDTKLDTELAFTPVKLGGDSLFEYPFSIMTGEGQFTLLARERENLRKYLDRGGFLLASASCSSPEWGRSFQREFQRVFPEARLIDIPMSHPMHKTVFEVRRIRLKNGGTTLLKGMEIDGRIVLVYTPEGLNDTANTEGCCCCGGNEIKDSHDINANIFTYSVLH